MNKTGLLQKLLFIFFIYSTAIYNSFAQEFSRIIPPSPTAVSLGKFGDIPVSYYTGTPNISIPLYEVQSGHLSLPITLSYNATGIRVAEDASWVGLGWSLSAGGLISRIIRGLDDFEGYYINDTLPPCNVENKYLYGEEACTDILGNLLPPWECIDTMIGNDGQYFRGMKDGYIDGEPDVFSYNFGSYSGKFVIDKQDNGSGVFCTVSNNLKIDFEPNGTAFTITTPDGNKYLFGTGEFVISRYNDSYITDPSTVTGVSGLDKGYMSANTSWYLDKVISPYGDTIALTYTNGESLSLPRKNEKDFHYLWINGPPTPTQYYGGSVSREYYADVYLEKITFKNGWIDFLTNDRYDIEAASAIKPQKLCQLKIYNLDSLLIKGINLGQSYFNQPYDTTYSGKRLKLDYIQIGHDSVNRYSFTYLNPNNLPNKFSKQVDVWGYYTHSFQSPGDIGYLLPDVTIEDMYGRTLHFPGVENWDQQTDTTGEYVTTGILTTIEYPTKGKTDFEYEVHDYRNGNSAYVTQSYGAVLDYTDPDPENYIEDTLDTFTLAESTLVNFVSSTDYQEEQSNVAWLKNSFGAYIFVFDNQNNTSTYLQLSAGTYTIEAKYIAGHRTQLFASYNKLFTTFYKGNGMRIKSITNYTDDSVVANKKRFIYTNTGNEENNCVCSSGLLLTSPKYYYTKKISYQDGDCPGLTCRGVYLVRTSSSYIPNGFYSPPNVVGYSKVAVIDENINGNAGKTVYNFYNEKYVNPDNEYEEVDRPFPEMPQMFDNRNGQLLSEEVFDATNNLVKRTDYEYESKERISIKGVKVYKAPFELNDYFEYEEDVRYYDNISEWWVQNSKKEVLYSNNDSITIINDYNYDNSAHKQITSSETELSDNTIRVTSFKYPHDFAGTQPYTTMVNTAHIWVPVIEQTTYKRVDTTNTFLSAVKTNYDFWDRSEWNAEDTTGLILSKTIATKNLNQPEYETKLRYHVYDTSGNPLMVSKENDQKLSYVWDYKQSYPIAQVANADVVNIAYTSFEADGTDNWGFGFNAIIEGGGAFTGVRFYDLDGGMWRNDLDSSKKYTLSFWAKEGTPGVNVDYPGGGSNIILFDDNPPKFSRNGWNYFELTIENAVGVGIWKWGHIAKTYIDEVRLYPDNAQMTTYTYSPLIGMTSETDMNNRTTYYEYDSLGRLNLVLDQDKNIVKKICYNYAGQPENCTIYYFNVEKSGSFTRNNCGLGSLGSTVLYTVPAGTHASSISQTDADAIAQADVDANGQDYANTVGTCTQLCIKCLGNDRKCFDGVCEMGVKIYEGTSEWDPVAGKYRCYYHYEFSDGSWSPSEYELSTTVCFGA